MVASEHLLIEISITFYTQMKLRSNLVHLLRTIKLAFIGLKVIAYKGFEKEIRCPVLIKMYLLVNKIERIHYRQS